MPEENNAIVQFPSVQDFCLNVPLYKPHTYFGSILNLYETYENFAGQLDCFCIDCKERSTFLSVEKEHVSIKLPILSPPPPLGSGMSLDQHFVYQEQENYRFVSDTVENRLVTLEFYCVRSHNHKLVFFFRFHDIRQINTTQNVSQNFAKLRDVYNKGYCAVVLTKIGQYPSLADLAASEIEKYRKILGQSDYREFSKAIGLTAHGIGIGAFVYLRRIFERLIEEAHQEAKVLKEWDAAAYAKSRMDEKIAALKNLLPSFLVEHKILYAILSKGIHELSEEECLQAFPIVKLAIELILDERIEKQEKERKIRDASKAIQNLSNSLTESTNKV